MGKRKLIVLALMSPVWFFTTPAFGEPKQDNSEQEIIKTDSLISNDTTLTASSSIDNYSTPVSDEDTDLMSIPSDTKEKDIYGLLGLIFGATGLVVSGLAYVDNRKKINQLKSEISGGNWSDIQKLLNDDKIKVEELENSYNRLNNDYAYLKKDYSELAEKFNRNFKNPNNESSQYASGSSQNGLKPGTNNSQSAVPETGREKKSTIYTTYVSSLSLDDRGEYSIPMYSLEPGNTQALFKVLLDQERGEGTYELNSNISNIAPFIDTLKMCAEGLSSSKSSGYKTLSPGRLKREGQVLKVVKKLQIG